MRRLEEYNRPSKVDAELKLNTHPISLLTDSKMEGMMIWLVWCGVVYEQAFVQIEAHVLRKAERVERKRKRHPAARALRTP